MGLYSIQQQLDACVRLSRQVANLDYDYSSLETLQYLLRKIRLACGSVSQANLSPSNLLFWSQCFLTATETLTKTASVSLLEIQSLPLTSNRRMQGLTFSCDCFLPVMRSSGNAEVKTPIKSLVR